MPSESTHSQIYTPPSSPRRTPSSVNDLHAFSHPPHSPSSHAHQSSACWPRLSHSPILFLSGSCLAAPSTPAFTRVVPRTTLHPAGPCMPASSGSPDPCSLVPDQRSLSSFAMLSALLLLSFCSPVAASASVQLPAMSGPPSDVWPPSGNLAEVPFLPRRQLSSQSHSSTGNPTSSASSADVSGSSPTSKPSSSVGPVLSFISFLICLEVPITLP
ncbi:hypothetical protein B0H21DRAFT_41236 [Amylocystis lapponica]|nr:hypothetical protein B0H21DRAFT_41236 [Amylocystis lapponica]